MTDAPKPHIAITENGPYLVTGGPVLTGRAPAMSTHGEALEWEPVEGKQDQARDRYALCRCGQSSHKPFCDGTHQKVGFDGTLTADRGPSADRRTVQVGEGVVMTDDRSLCTHAGFCGTRFANVHEMIEDSSDPEVRAQIKRMVANCPSGRLQFSLKEDGEPVEPEYIPSIAPTPDGPLWVRGGIAIQGPDGFTYEVRNRVTLCRCGQSKNKPFCDGTHQEVGFEAD